MTQFQVYDRGFVKEGVGAGGSAIAAHLHGHWQNSDILQASEALLTAYLSSGAV
jgi:NaMN:DMB phosphoribosyltransferase